MDSRLLPYKQRNRRVCCTPLGLLDSVHCHVQYASFGYVTTCPNSISFEWWVVMSRVCTARSPSCHPSHHESRFTFDSTLQHSDCLLLFVPFYSVKYSGLLYSKNNNSPSRRHACIVHKTHSGKNHWEKKLEESNLSVLMHDHDASISIHYY